MSMFVEDSEVIEVQVHYSEDGKKIAILEAPAEGSKSMTVTFRYPDFATSQRLVASSTTVDSGGNPTVNFLMLQNNMLYLLARSWDAKDKDGKPIELSIENIGRLRVEVARALITRLSQDVGQLM